MDPREEIKSIIDLFSGVLPDSLPPGIPPRIGVNHKIDLEHGSMPMAKAPYWMRRWKGSALLMDTLAELESHGFIRPSAGPSASVYGTPVVFITKKDGTICLCVDY